MDAPDRRHLIRAPKAARALASPIRQEIVDVLESAGPSTIAELAAHLDRPADGLYFHIRALERVGLLRKVGEKGEGRAKSAQFDVIARPMRLDYSGSPSARVARVGPTLDGILRLARRDVRRALNQGRARVDGETRELWVARSRGRVSPEDLARLNTLLEECARIVREGRSDTPDAVPIALAFALTPVRPSRRPRTRSQTTENTKGADP